MDNSTIWAQYENRLERVCDHIHANLDNDLDMNQLAQVACLSPFHWHRIYRAIYGETITATVKRLRLNRAAGELANSTTPLSDIAVRAGYPNIQSFNRTFKKIYGLPPGQYRSHQTDAIIKGKQSDGKPAMYDVKFTTQEALGVTGINYQGPYSDVGLAFEKLYALAATRNLFDKNTRSIGVYYDDPCVIEPKKQRSFACLTSSNYIEQLPPLEAKTIAGGKYAVFRYVGPYSGIESCYQWIFSHWLRNCEHQLRDEVGFTEYLNPREKSPSMLVTDIYLPIT